MGKKTPKIKQILIHITNMCKERCMYLEKHIVHNSLENRARVKVKVPSREAIEVSPKLIVETRLFSLLAIWYFKNPEDLIVNLKLSSLPPRVRYDSISWLPQLSLSCVTIDWIARKRKKIHERFFPRSECATNRNEKSRRRKRINEFIREWRFEKVFDRKL